MMHFMLKESILELWTEKSVIQSFKTVALKKCYCDKWLNTNICLSTVTLKDIFLQWCDSYIL